MFRSIDDSGVVGTTHCLFDLEDVLIFEGKFQNFEPQFSFG
jgi:hypothetical protein